MEQRTPHMTPLAAPRTFSIESASLFNMQADLRDTVNLLRAALLIAQHGEQHDLEREEMAALAAVVNQAHSTAQTLRAIWQDSIGEV